MAVQHADDGYSRRKILAVRGSITIIIAHYTSECANKINLKTKTR